MGLTKSELFTAYQNEIAVLSKVLAHPARIAIIEHLLKTKACINGDLVQELGLAQPTISQHLRELKRSGLIKGSIEGVSVNYCIDTEKWAYFKRSFADFFARFDESDKFLCC